jgi:hypothetical protein
MKRIIIAAIFVSLISAEASSQTLSEALDTDLIITTSGQQHWVPQAESFVTDEYSARSGSITHSQESLMQTTVIGEGTLSFDWKVSSEENYDFLEFYIDGSLQDRITGTEAWQKELYTITSPGLHTLQWRYVKDSSISRGDDSGRVNKLEWTGEIALPQDTLSDALDTSLTFTTDGDAEWFSQNSVAFLMVTPPRRRTSRTTRVPG